MRQEAETRAHRDALVHQQVVPPEDRGALYQSILLSRYP